MVPCKGAEIRYQHSVLAFTDCEDGALLDVTDENQQAIKLKGALSLMPVVLAEYYLAYLI